MDSQGLVNMNSEPRLSEEYSERQVKAAHRVLMDVGQVLASFKDCLVLVGGWIPDLLLPEASDSHTGSIDVDLALDAEKLNDGRYAELLKLLLDTRRYRQGEKQFQLVTDVDLNDGDKPIQVAVEFLAPKEIRLEKHKPKLLEGFRVLQADGCGAAFRAPVEQALSGQNTRGVQNTVHLRLASLPDFLVMKAFAIGGRDKPKDSYDLCYCLEHCTEGIEALAEVWKNQLGDPNVAKAKSILSEKFERPESFGPQQVVEFNGSTDPTEKAMQARKAYELVQKFLQLAERRYRPTR